MVEWFFSESPALKDEMRVAQRAEDWARLAAAAHRLGGTLMYLGARSAEQAARKLEEACDGDPGEVASTLEEFEREIGRLEPALVPYRKTGTP